MHEKKVSSKPFVISGTILCLFLVLGVLAVFSLARYEKQRDLNNWQITLSVLADSRAAAVSNWVEDRLAVLRELAANGSLQLYTQQLLRHPGEEGEREAVELSYLRNLLMTTAQRSFFFDQSRTLLPPVQANVAFAADSGLSLLADRGRVIVSTPGFTPPSRDLQEIVDEVLSSGKVKIFDFHRNANNQPVLGFVVPVFALQQQEDEQKPVAVLYGFTHAASLFQLLEVKSLATRSAETMLVRPEGNLVTYLTPLADGTLPLQRSLAANTRNLVAATAIAQPGIFGTGIDYTGQETLFTSRGFAELPWILIQKISAGEALAESKQHEEFLFIVLFLALLVASSLLIAAWWHGSSVKERQTARELLMKSRQLEAQTRLLAAINDNMTDFILLLDHRLRIIFANMALARSLGTRAEELSGKRLVSLFGPDAAKQFEQPVGKAVQEGTVISEELTFEINGESHTFLATFLSVAYEYDNHDSLLISLNDVTSLYEAQTRKERLMKQIVSSLMRAIDLHDPHSANHSARTSVVALAVGKAMELDSTLLATIETASMLCNLGKLSIPRDILVKTGPLTEKEQKILRRETKYAEEILSRIDFEGPVLQTIVQKNEFLDGSGYPGGLSGEEIILPARILAAANAFVAMTSPRAYRDRLGVQTAMDQLLQDSESRYDRHVIAALFHVVENEIDWSRWQ